MQGIFIDGKRPMSKKAVKEMVAMDPSRVVLEATSMVGKEENGPVDDLPQGTYNFVGPDPYRVRKFYGNLIVTVHIGEATGRVSRTYKVL